MKPLEQYKFIPIANGIISFLLLLFIALGCEKNEPTSQTDSFSRQANNTPQNRQSKNADPVSMPTNATEITGKVVGISDGDTITVLDNNKKQYKIRLQGIDSPESGQPFGQAAKQNLSALIFGKTVKVLIYKKDRYNRSL